MGRRRYMHGKRRRKSSNPPFKNGDMTLAEAHESNEPTLKSVGKKAYEAYDKVRDIGQVGASFGGIVFPVLDVLNAVGSGVRAGENYLMGNYEEAKKHGKAALWNTAAVIPVAGDAPVIAKGASKLSKGMYWLDTASTMKDLGTELYDYTKSKSPIKEYWPDLGGVTNREARVDSAPFKHLQGNVEAHIPFANEAAYHEYHGGSAKAKRATPANTVTEAVSEATADPNFNDEYFESINKKTPHHDSLGENILEFFDPTGISSWDDAYRAYNKEDWGLDEVLDMAGAIPFFGRAARWMKAGKKGFDLVKGLSKTQKAVRTGQDLIEMGDLASDISEDNLNPVDQVSNPKALSYNPDLPSTHNIGPDPFPGWRGHSVTHGGVTIGQARNVKTGDKAREFIMSQGANTSDALTALSKWGKNPNEDPVVKIYNKKAK